MLGVPGTAEAAAAAAAAAQRAVVSVYSQIQHVGRRPSSPPTTAECEAAFHVAQFRHGGLGVPDVSMSAACNGAVDVYMGLPGLPAGWFRTCGTSEASPLLAGVVALAAQDAGHPLGLINPPLYRMPSHGAPGLANVTSGNNTVSFTQHGRIHTVRGFSTRPGYSLVDGVGAVNGALFIPELAGYGRL